MQKYLGAARVESSLQIKENKTFYFKKDGMVFRLMEFQKW